MIPPMSFSILSCLPPPLPLFLGGGWGGGGGQQFVLSGIPTLVCRTAEGQTGAWLAIRYGNRTYFRSPVRQLFVHPTTVFACTDEFHHRL